MELRPVRQTLKVFTHVSVWLVIVSLAISGCHPQTTPGSDTLVLLDNLVLKETHSQFFRSLQDGGYQLTFKLSDDTSLTLKKYGVWQYSNLIIFAPSTDEFGGDLSTDTIAEFVDNGGNLLVIGSPNSGDAIKDLAPEFGLEFDDTGAYAIDHSNFNAALDSGKHTVIELKEENLVAPAIICDARKVKPLLYEGSTLLVDPENPLVMEILVASSSAYSHSPNSDITQYPHTVGKNAILIGALQARNNARVVISGSSELFSNRFFGGKVTADGKPIVSGNQDFVRELVNWNFMKKGVLRLSNVTHHKAGVPTTANSYTIMEDVVYQVVIEELQKGVWSAYSAQDIQLEFVRIDPFVRVNLTPVPGTKNGLYEAKFKIPDVYGVYQFKIDYKKKGYTFLSSATQVSIRPLQHTEYERFIPGAFPYYASAFSMMIGLLLFSCVFLHYKDKDSKDKSE